MRRAAVAVALLALALAGMPGVAVAAGDPPSDVQIYQDAFLPWDAGASTAEQAQLGAVLAAAARSGYPIRVAIIASQADLGSVTQLWGQPQAYAKFLDVELSYGFQGRVLVVMPNGFGLAATTRLLPAELAVITAAQPARARSALATGAETTIAKLAAAAGHPLHLSGLPVAAPSTTGYHKDKPGPLIAFLIGAALIGAAWTASLRARPVSLRAKST
jgi:hypothetical protein